MELPATLIILAVGWSCAARTVKFFYVHDTLNTTCEGQVSLRAVPTVGEIGQAGLVGFCVPPDPVIERLSSRFEWVLY